MENTKHTPGPWKYSDLTKMVFSLDKSGMDDKGICNVNENNFEANAKLIAAAPEMLEALIELRKFYTDTTGLPAVKANAAIEKATT